MKIYRNFAGSLSRLSLAILLAGPVACVYRPLMHSQVANFPTDDEPLIEQVALVLSDVGSQEAYNDSRYPPPSLEITKEVMEKLRRYIHDDSRFIPLALQRGAKYLGPIRQILEQEGLPETLINVALIESGFQPEARSSAGAYGIWQFTRGTARAYGLKVDLVRDERRDPLLSSVAAARLLKDLYDQFGDWYLALAAYNAGPAAIKRAIDNGGTRDFWSLVRADLINTQTSQFVPRFIAASLIVREFENNGGEYRPDIESLLFSNGYF